ncbi:MAG: hypothetical protein HOC09_18105 [Deltaproteobacteria bacterium]|jgi:hypothetical protein|nr:hypothetical protein [Deltaproteobacteria bacterium]
MADTIVTSDLPSWISAWSSVIGVTVAAIALIFSGIATFRTRKISFEYAIVNQDGTILSHRGFKEYGLHVIPNAKLKKGDPNYGIPGYTLSFKKLPEYFEISTREGAVVKLSQIGPMNFTLIFVGVGFGSPTISCNFKIQVY